MSSIDAIGSIGIVAAILACMVILVWINFARRRALKLSLRGEIALRQKSEQDARTERARLKAVFDTAVDAIVIIDRDGHILQWSHGAQKIFGFSSDEVIGKDLTILMPEPHRTRHAKYVAAYMASGDAKIIGIGRELTAVRKDGREFPMELAVSEVRVDGDLFFTGIMRDITERKRAENELIRAREQAEAANIASRSEITLRQKSEQDARTERARLKAVFDTAVDAIVIIERSGRILQWSQGAQKIFGFSSDEVIGQDLTMLMPEPHRTRHAKYVAAYMASGDAKIIGIGRELTAVRKDGTEFPMELAVNEVKVDGDLFFAGIMRDITERKHAENELIRAREQAEAANVAKSQFLATMSHEIRTPLNGVIGMASLLASTDLDERQTHLVTNLSRSGKSLLAIINDILDFSKIEAGRLELFSADAAPRDIVAEIADLFSERCAAKGLELVYFVDDEVPVLVETDPVRLRQVLANLVGNALKFTDRGEILIEVGCQRKDGGEVVLSFAVEDTGIGIAAEKCSQVFQSFRQVDSSMTRSKGGTGLGLAISRQLVELMGGTIGLQSELGRGSRFFFTIKAKPSGNNSAGPKRELSRPLRALVAESNAVSSHVLSLYFELWRIETHFVQTANEVETAWSDAIERRAPFDVVLLDLKGMGEAGIGLGAKIRADKRAHSAEVIFMIGIDRIVADKSLGAVDAIATLTKPIRPSDLFDALVDVASGAHARGGERSYNPRRAGAKRFNFNARVLVAEDNPVNQDVATGILENMGCRVVTAPNGAVATRLLAQEKFDLVFMDCEMPEMDGFEAARRARELENLTQGLSDPDSRANRTPIIALTAHALADIRDRCLASGMDDFLTKPFDDAQIGETLYKWIPKLERDTLAAAAPEAAAPAAAAPAAVAPKAVAPAEANQTLEPLLQEFPIDRATLEKISSFDGPAGFGLFQRVVARFSDTAPGLAATLHERYGAGDGEQVWRTAHALKSSAAALGALRLAKLCQEIETIARDSGAAAIEPLIAALEKEIAAALSGLAGIVGERDGSKSKHA